VRALVPEDLTRNGAADRRSLVRAITARALGTLRRSDPGRIMKSAWPDDRSADLALRVITRAASLPMTTGAAPALAVEAVRVLPLLAPRSAALRLFNSCMTFDMTGVATMRIPNVGTVPAAKFIAEDTPAPVMQLGLGKATLGPLKKILALAATSAELENASPENASAILGRVLAASAQKGLDAVVFASAAGTDAQPPGLFYGATPIVPTAGGGSTAMATDLGNLIKAIAAAGIDPASMIIVAAPAQALRLKLTAGTKFDYQIIEAAMLADGTVAAFAPDAIACAIEGEPDIEISRDVTVHFEDTTPQQFSTAGSPAVVAAPQRNAFQIDVVVVKVHARCTWTVAAPGGAQVINGATW
jgi:Phage capsid family